MKDKRNNKQPKKSQQSSQRLGEDQDEQRMNGDYGMLETEQEDQLHNHKN